MFRKLVLSNLFLILFNCANAQLNKIWMCENEGFYYWTCNDTNNADMSFKMDFNFEPPLFSLIKKPISKISYTPVRNLCANDINGNILIYDNIDHFFLNKNHQIIYNKNKFSNFEQSTSSLLFPTSADSIYLIVNLLDTLFYKSKLYGQIFFKLSLFNVNEKKFTQTDATIDFDKSLKYNPLNHVRFNVRTGFACHIFNQIYDEKDDKYFLYFNLGDSIYISEYHKETMTFEVPKTSGLIISGRGDRNINVAINFPAFGFDDIVHSSNNNYILHQNLNTERLLSGNALSELTLYKFDKNSAQFYSPLLIDSFRYLNENIFSRVFAPCDTIIYYCVRSHTSFSNKLIKVILNKDLNKILHKYVFYFNNTNLFIDMKLAPNGKIAASVDFNNNATSSHGIRFINNPNDPTSLFEISEIIDYSKDLNLSCQFHRILFFPNTPGVYKRAEFKYEQNCKGNGVRFINHSDTFWFKSFKFYLGNGDSLEHNHLQNIVNYQYQNPGKYFVKLKAFTKEGGWVWFSDSIEVKTAPTAQFDIQSKPGCQYVAFEFIDQSESFQLKKDSMIQHRWSYGDGNTHHWSSYNIKQRKNVFHTYNTSGTFSVRHIVSDGFCADTVTKDNQVLILPAPKPGILKSDSTGCVPFAINFTNQNNNLCDSTHWLVSDNRLFKTIPPLSVNIPFNNAGKFKVVQKLFGTTGCITYDTTEINALQGIDKNINPQLINVTVKEKNILLYWIKVANANEYQVYRNSILINTVTDTFYIDNQVQTNDLSYQYHIVARDVCQNNTQQSNVGNSILAKIKPSGKELAIIEWNPYMGWQNGVKTYSVFHLNENSPNLLKQDSLLLNYNDPDFLINGKTEKCYEIVAQEYQGNSSQSHSNQVCLDYESIIWVPTAITINGDGLNESLQLNTYGIFSYSLSIYNRWGQLVYEMTQDSDQWHPTPEQQGIYMYVLKAQTQYGDYLTKGTITVLR